MQLFSNPKELQLYNLHNVDTVPVHSKKNWHGMK